MTAVSVVVLMRRQLRESARDIVDPFTGATATAATVSRLTPDPSDRLDLSTSDLHTHLTSLKEPPPTHTTFRPAPLPASLGQNIQNLKSAQFKVILVGLNTVVSGVVFACVSAWAAPIQTLQVHGTTWAQREQAFFLLSECWAILLTPVSVGVTWQAYKQMPPKVPKQTAMLADEREMA